MVRKASVRPRGRPGYVESPEDLHGLSYYIRRAEDLLAGLTDTKESLTLGDRAMLERHLARALEIAPKPDPLVFKDKRALYTFVEIVGALGPRLQTLRNRAEGDWQAEIKDAANRATAKARAAKANKSPGTKEQKLRRRIGELDTGNLPTWSEANTMLDALQREGFKGPHDAPIKVDAVKRRIELLRSQRF
jgi:hypothetical protein